MLDKRGFDNFCRHLSSKQFWWLNLDRPGSIWCKQIEQRLLKNSSMEWHFTANRRTNRCCLNDNDIECN